MSCSSNHWATTRALWVGTLGGGWWLPSCSHAHHNYGQPGLCRIFIHDPKHAGMLLAFHMDHTCMEAVAWCPSFTQVFPFFFVHCLYNIHTHTNQTLQLDEAEGHRSSSITALAAQPVGNKCRLPHKHIVSALMISS